MSSGTPSLTRRERRADRRLAERERGAWAPRWFWPSFAAPATLYLLIFFVFPFYVVLAVTFGGIDPLLRQPVPAWNPTTWLQTGQGIFSFTMSNILHTDGLYSKAFVNTFVFVGISTFLCLLIGYPFAYFLARRAGRFKSLFLVLFFAPFWISYMLRMLAWISLLQDDGYVNKVLERLGLISQPYSWLSGKPSTLIFGLVYGYVPFMILPLFAHARPDPPVPPRGRPRPRSEPREDVLAGHAPAIPPGDPRRVRDLRAADVRRLLHPTAARRHAQDAHDRERDRRCRSTCRSSGSGARRWCSSCSSC